MSSSTLRNGSHIGCIEARNENFVIEWIIKNFSRLPQGEGGYVFSPDFSTVNKGVNCYFELCPQGDAEDDAGYVSIYLCATSLKPDVNIDVEINVEISILPSGSTRKLQLTSINGWEGCRKLVEKSKLLELCDSDDTVTIRCKIDIPWEIDVQEGQLSQDFCRLFKELPKLSDVTVVVGIQKFPAHKVVLATRSPVFSAMFEHEETRENLKNEVTIKEMEPAVVKAMLEFFYTDEVTSLEELAYGLLGAAEKYGVPRLKTICEKFLYKTLSNDNAAEILIHSDLYRSYKLKEHVMEFMTNYLSAVVKSECYKKMKEKYPELVKELVRSIAIQQESKKRKLT